MLEAIAIGAISGTLGTATYEGLSAGFRQLSKLRPDLEQRAKDAKALHDNEELGKIANEARDALILEARSGTIQLSGAALNALGLAKLDHGNGNIGVSNSHIMGQQIEIGGGSGSLGRTVLGSNTRTSTPGTGIDIGNGCEIVITGNASIKQT